MPGCASIFAGRDGFGAGVSMLDFGFPPKSPGVVQPESGLAIRARFAVFSMCLAGFVTPHVHTQAQPAAPPMQTPAPAQGSTPEQMAVPQTPPRQTGEKSGDSHPSEPGVAKLNHLVATGFHDL